MAKRDSKDYYRVLHVDPKAPVEIIRASYRTLMQRLKQHPDLGGDHNNAALINEAYKVLTNTVTRAAYDRARNGRVRTSKAGSPATELGGRCLFCNAVVDSAPMPPPDDHCPNCATPLFPADRIQLDASGKRMLERMQRDLPVTCYTAWPQRSTLAATMHDLSLNGMQISANFYAAPGSLLKVDSEPCQSLARVAYCTADGANWIIGLEFVTLRFSRRRGSFISAEV